MLVLARVAPGITRAASPLRAAMIALAGNPRDEGLATAAARLAIEDGRLNADPRRYGQAQAALAPWWGDADPPQDIRVLRAVIRQAFHDFAGATADLDAILERTPGNAQARLSRAFVRMVTGDTMAAAQDCALLPRNIATIVTQICLARIEALTGSGEKARGRLTRALGTASEGNSPMRQFAKAVLADVTIGLGEANAAVSLYAEASAASPNDAPLLAAYADLLLDLDRPADVLALLDDKGDADILLLRRAIAARRLGDARLSNWSAVLAERFAAAAAGGVRVHLRENARYLLEVRGDASGALALARENWTVQKEPADARLLVESAIAAGDPTAARDIETFAARTGLDDYRVRQALARRAGGGQ
jgi:hypothetical protein